MIKKMSAIQPSKLILQLHAIPDVSNIAMYLTSVFVIVDCIVVMVVYRPTGYLYNYNYNNNKNLYSATYSVGKALRKISNIFYFCNIFIVYHQACPVRPISQSPRSSYL